jgi:Protein of unknown function (DUF2933)
MSTQDRPSGRSFLATPAGIALCVFLAIAAFFLWVEHRAHVLGVLPWLLLAACPLLHLFMHRGGHGGPHGPEQGGERR